MSAWADPSRVMSGVDASIERLRRHLRVLERVVVAFSGGADSAFLAWMAQDTLGKANTHVVTAVSASLAPEEARDCASLADEWDLRWTAVLTHELANEAYVANAGDRCFHCKTELMAVAVPMADAEGAVVVLGVNLDDLVDHRPGQRAALDHGAVFPLVEAGFTKVEVREASRRLGLRTWDKPAAACLASRVPYGTPVTVGVLESVARAEGSLRRLGFRQLRVRHHGEVARVELGVDEMTAGLDCASAVVEAVKEAGYRYVTLDLEGFRSGNLNQALNQTLSPTPQRRSSSIGVQVGKAR
ncbi:MAG: ATP-dependent sacrificial sulfur transferase LarE [Acidimicrobiales bacterium]